MEHKIDSNTLFLEKKGIQFESNKSITIKKIVSTI